MTKSKTATMTMFRDIMPQAAQAPAANPEPTPAEAAQTQTRGQKYAPMSVYVSAKQREILEQIAKATGQKRHAVLQYAIRKVCNDWENGIWPEMELQPRLK